MTEKWDMRFLRLAYEVSKWSKDPSTQVGAVLVRPDRTVASVGYNGFPRSMRDTQEHYDNREEKYSRIVHAEINAILQCQDRDTQGYTLYTWPFLPCDRCASQVIQAGIKRVVTIDNSNPRWHNAFKQSIKMCDSSGVEVFTYWEKYLDVIKEERY